MNWRRLTNHIWWKIGSLVISVLLWLVISVQPVLVTTRTMPVYYQNLSRDLLMAAEVPDTVHVELRGPSGKLSPASLGDTAVRLDLSPITGPSERTFTLSSANLNLPQGVEFLRAMPSQLRLVFDRNLIKDVPIEIRFAGSPPPGFRIASQEAEPMMVRIAGPEAHVKVVDMAHTDAIDLASATGDTAVRVNVFVRDSQVRLESSPIVTVRLSIVKAGNAQ